MKVTRKEFKSKDFEKVRDFLQETYSVKSSNWCIERWSWSRYSVGYWLDIFETWPSTVGMWVDESDEIVALVSTEGNLNGNVFFQLIDVEYSEDFIHEMLKYSEEHLCKSKEKKKIMYPRVNNICKASFANVLGDRGYSKTDNSETNSTIKIKNKMIIELPSGFSIMPASTFEAENRAQAHGRAFGGNHLDKPNLMDERTRSFNGLILAPDYNEYLDLCIVDEENVIASFATFWFDSKNSIGLLEPLGTIMKYRRMGLGKALVYEGMNRLRLLGANKLNVGSNQKFYKDIGFSVESQTEIWTKELVTLSK